MASVCGLTLVKAFDYRGDPNEEFSNTYHFKGAVPSDDTGWMTLMGQAAAAEGHVLPAAVHYTRAYGYDSDDPAAHHVFSYTWPTTSTTGDYPRDTLQELPIAGDQAAMVWWKTARLNSRGKPIYLRKYLHGGFIPNTGGDQLSTPYHTALGIFVGLTTGMNAVHGGLRSRTHDETIVESAASQWVTTRTLKRRGKRPKTGS